MYPRVVENVSFIHQILGESDTIMHTTHSINDNVVYKYFENMLEIVVLIIIIIIK